MVTVLRDGKAAKRESVKTSMWQGRKVAFNRELEVSKLGGGEAHIVLIGRHGIFTHPVNASDKPPWHHHLIGDPPCDDI